MSGLLITLAVLLVYAVWGGVVALKWVTTRTLQKEVYPQYIEDGTLRSTVTEEEFAPMFMRVEGPRFGLHLYAAALAAPFIIVIALRIFNLIWGFIWKRSGELGWFEVGELPHSLMVVFLYVAILFAIAWFTMRRYHLAAPGSFKTELRRLNGEDL